MSFIDAIGQEVLTRYGHSHSELTEEEEELEENVAAA